MTAEKIYRDAMNICEKFSIFYLFRRKTAIFVSN